jgi:RNA polymerase sigma factor (sigma-70 family)
MGGAMTPGKLRVVAQAKSSEDAASLARIAGGDLSGLGELYDAYAQDLWRFVRRAAPREDAEDVVHTVFVRLVAIAGSYDARAPSARAWLFGVTAQVLRERRRSLQRFANAMLAHAQLARNSLVASDTTSVDIDRALSSLSEAKRIVLLLAEVEGFSSPEIAVMLGIPVGTVWTRLHHARRKLRDHFGEGA